MQTPLNSEISTRCENCQSGQYVDAGAGYRLCPACGNWQHTTSTGFVPVVEWITGHKGPVPPPTRSGRTRRRSVRPLTLFEDDDE